MVETIVFYEILEIYKYILWQGKQRSKEILSHDGNYTENEWR